MEKEKEKRRLNVAFSRTLFCILKTHCYLSIRYWLFVSMQVAQRRVAVYRSDIVCLPAGIKYWPPQCRNQISLFVSQQDAHRVTCSSCSSAWLQFTLFSTSHIFPHRKPAGDSSSSSSILQTLDPHPHPTPVWIRSGSGLVKPSYGHYGQRAARIRPDRICMRIFFHTLGTKTP